MLRRELIATVADVRLYLEARWWFTLAAHKVVIEELRPHTITLRFELHWWTRLLGFGLFHWLVHRGLERDMRPRLPAGIDFELEVA